MMKILYAICCLAAIGLGVMHGKMAYVAEKTAKKTATGINSTGVSDTRPPETSAPKIPKNFKALFASAEELYKSGRFGEAEGRYGRAARLLKNQDMTDDEKFTDACRGEHLCHVFNQLYKATPKNQLVDEDELVRLRIKSDPDKPVVGKFISEEDGKISLQNEYDETDRFRMSDVTSRDKISSDEYRDILTIGLNEKVKKAQGAVTIYTDGAYYAMRHGLLDRAPELLDRAFREEGWEVIIDIFLGHMDTEKLKSRVNIAYGREHVVIVMLDDPPRPPPGTGTGTGPTPLPTGTAGTLPPINTGIDKPPPPPVFDNEKHKRAEILYQEGMQYFGKSLPGKPNYRHNMRMAFVILPDARDLFQELYDKTRESRFERKLQVIQQSIFFLTRELTLKDMDKVEEIRDLRNNK